MKTVVITGSARGFGYELAKYFRMNDYNVVLSDINSNVSKSRDTLFDTVKGNGRVISVICDVTREDDLNNLMKETIKNFKSCDVWINNAGVNQLMVPIWEINSNSMSKLIDIDLKGAIMGSKIAMKQMITQGYGQIYSVEGYGSNDAIQTGLSIYGTSKRAITYFMDALAFEAKSENTNVLVGKISPGIMITDFITSSVNNKSFELDDKTKKVYNILGDYPDVIAEFMVNKIINNKKNNVRFNWLTNSKAFKRFMFSSFNKRDFFNNKKENN